MNLEGNVALVTGGAQRVGRAISLELARAGCDVSVHHHRSIIEADALVMEIGGMGRRAIATRGDLNEPSVWPRIVGETVHRLGRMDILVNNAAVFPLAPPDTLEGFDASFWEKVFRTNLIAPMALAHHCGPHLKAHGAGQIVNLCDICVERPWPEHLAYCASKAALTTMTRALARALAPSIRVNGVAPGIAVFPDEYSAELRQRLVRQVPLRREGTPEDIAHVVRFLVEVGDYVTGQIIPVDGGRSIA